MTKKHKLYSNRCVYNILGSNPNNRIGIPKVSKVYTTTYKPNVRTRTKAIRPNTGRRFN